MFWFVYSVVVVAVWPCWLPLPFQRTSSIPAADVGHPSLCWHIVPKLLAMLGVEVVLLFSAAFIPYLNWSMVGFAPLILRCSFLHNSLRSTYVLVLSALTNQSLYTIVYFPVFLMIAMK